MIKVHNSNLNCKIATKKQNFIDGCKSVPNIICIIMSVPCPISAAESIPNRTSNVWQHDPKITSLTFIRPWFVDNKFKLTQVNMRQQQILIPPSSSMFCRAIRADRCVDVGIPIIVGILSVFTICLSRNRNSLCKWWNRFIAQMK